MKRLISLKSGLIILCFLASCEDKESILIPETISVQTVDDIYPVQDSLVKPVLYQNVPDFGTLTIPQVKEKFISLILPGILVAKHHLKTKSDSITLLSEKENWLPEDSIFFSYQCDKFKAKSASDLLLRMKTHPNSLVLAQAAVESGWGSSRFFREANNVFGIWSYSTNEPRMPASKASVFVRKYGDISQSIEDYFVTIGRARPYSNFRKIRAETESVSLMIPHLKHYSQRGKDYTDLLKKIIEQNNLTRFDNYIIDPKYFVEQ